MHNNTSTNILTNADNSIQEVLNKLNNGSFFRGPRGEGLHSRVESVSEFIKKYNNKNYNLIELIKQEILKTFNITNIDDYRVDEVDGVKWFDFLLSKSNNDICILEVDDKDIYVMPFIFYDLRFQPTSPVLSRYGIIESYETKRKISNLVDLTCLLSISFDTHNQTWHITCQDILPRTKFSIQTNSFELLNKDDNNIIINPNVTTENTNKENNTNPGCKLLIADFSTDITSNNINKINLSNINDDDRLKLIMGSSIEQGDVVLCYVIYNNLRELYWDVVKQENQTDLYINLLDNKSFRFNLNNSELDKILKERGHSLNIPINNNLDITFEDNNNIIELNLIKNNGEDVINLYKYNPDNTTIDIHKNINVEGLTELSEMPIIGNKKYPYFIVDKTGDLYTRIKTSDTEFKYFTYKLKQVNENVKIVTEIKNIDEISR